MKDIFCCFCKPAAEKPLLLCFDKFFNSVIFWPILILKKHILVMYYERFVVLLFENGFSEWRQFLQSFCRSTLEFVLSLMASPLVVWQIHLCSCKSFAKIVPILNNYNSRSNCTRLNAKIMLFFLFFRARNRHETVSETIVLIIKKRGSLHQCNDMPEFAKYSLLTNVEAVKHLNPDS